MVHPRDVESCNSAPPALLSTRSRCLTVVGSTGGSSASGRIDRNPKGGVLPVKVAAVTNECKNGMPWGPRSRAAGSGAKCSQHAQATGNAPDADLHRCLHPGRSASSVGSLGQTPLVVTTGDTTNGTNEGTNGIGVGSRRPGQATGNVRAVDSFHSSQPSGNASNAGSPSRTLAVVATGVMTGTRNRADGVSKIKRRRCVQETGSVLDVGLRHSLRLDKSVSSAASQGLLVQEEEKRTAGAMTSVTMAVRAEETQGVAEAVFPGSRRRAQVTGSAAAAAFPQFLHPGRNASNAVHPAVGKGVASGCQYMHVQCHAAERYPVTQDSNVTPAVRRMQAPIDAICSFGGFGHYLYTRVMWTDFAGSHDSDSCTRRGCTVSSDVRRCSKEHKSKLQQQPLHVLSCFEFDYLRKARVCQLIMAYCFLYRIFWSSLRAQCHPLFWIMHASGAKRCEA